MVIMDYFDKYQRMYNHPELKAVKKALRVYRRYPASGDWSRPGGWVSLIRGRSMLLWEDNMMIVSQIVKWNARSMAAREDLRKTMQIMREEDGPVWGGRSPHQTCVAAHARKRPPCTMFKITPFVLAPPFIYYLHYILQNPKRILKKV
jgi:hypothetical protein